MISQNFYGSIGTMTNIETVRGNISIDGRQILTSKSNAKDLVKQLTDIQSAVAVLPGLDQEIKEKVLAGIDAAKRETISEKPKGNKIKSQLDVAAGALQSASTAASNALSLGKVLFAIGTWALALFA